MTSAFFLCIVLYCVIFAFGVQGHIHDNSFNERFFNVQMEKSMTHVRQLLESSKQPTFVSEVSHTYQDKYLVVEFVINTALSAMTNILSSMGTTPAQLSRMIDWAKQYSVSLRFDTVESCDFDRQVMREHQDSKTVRVVEDSDRDGKTTVDRKTVFNVTDYYWNYRVDYKLYVCKGVGEGAEDCVSLSTVSEADVLVVQGNSKPPKESLRTRPSVSRDITTYLRAFLSADSTAPLFGIDRNASTCFTPRRNEDVDRLLRQLTDLHQWALDVDAFLISVFPKGNQFRSILAEDVFVPVLPVVVDCSQDGITEEACHDLHSNTSNTHGDDTAVTMLSSQTMTRLLDEQLRTLNRLRSQVERKFSNSAASGEMVPTPLAVAAQLHLSVAHLAELCSQTYYSVVHIEKLMRQQLVSAIGKDVQPVDVAAYMIYHDHKIFKPEYLPQPFSYAVRRSAKHSPEGRVAVEVKYPRLPGGSKDLSSYDIVNDAPIYTSTQVRRWSSAGQLERNGSAAESSGNEASSAGADQPLMRFDIDSSTTISLRGEMLVHSYLQSRFSHQRQGYVADPELFLTAEARQFSSFLVLIGRISSASTFAPSSAIIVKNKDSLRIPLQMAVIPTEKEFRDAIESLSPEQRQFARAFRGMQMQHTLFGVCVIQIKPQLEKVLNLPPDSLTKEIALTEDLMELFIDYQIPTDLLSSESAAAAGGQIDSGGDSSKTIQESGVAAGAIAEVKANVAAIQSMISRAKEKELEEKKMADEMLNKLQKQKVFQYTAEYGASVDAADVADSGSGRILRSAPMFMAEESFSSQQSTVPSSAPVAATSTSFQSAAQDEAESMSSSPSQPLQYSNSTYDVGSARTKWYDVTSLPASLQEKFEVHLQKNSIVRPSIITAGVTWTLRSYANLFAEARSKEIGNDQQRSEKLKVYGLLDALTKSGALEIDGATVHVIVASAHIFDDNVMDTIVQSNVNPIEKMEWSSLVMASVVHDTPVEELVQGAEIMERVQSHFHLSPIVNEV